MFTTHVSERTTQKHARQGLVLSAFELLLKLHDRKSDDWKRASNNSVIIRDCVPGFKEHVVQDDVLLFRHHRFYDLLTQYIK